MLVLLLFILLQNTNAVIYRLNDSQYALMPPIVHLDHYEACQLDADALYCTAEVLIVSEQPSQLLDMIQEYSEHEVSHYNHTKIRRGVCLTQTCKSFYKFGSGDLKMVLEACLNDSFTNKYELKTNVLDYYCQPPGKAAKDIDLLDVIVGVISVIFLIANIVGSLSEIFFSKDSKNKAIRFLLCFSLQRNWNKLVAHAGEHQDNRVKRLKGFHGVRTILASFVILSHSIITAVLLTENYKFIEELYINKLNHLLINGTLIMQIYLMMSAFLLVYLWLKHSEKHDASSWLLLPKFIVIRWLRLTPSYAYILALNATWFAHLSSGPFWSRYVAVEMNDCRQYWWYNILYINNFFSNSECNIQAWYLAADTQLYFLGVIVFLACRTPRSRVVTLSLLFIVGMIIPAVIVYLQDLDGILMIPPEVVINLFIRDPYYSNVYIRSYCNIVGYVIGMAMGYLVYHWQKQGVDFKKYQTFTYRLMYWSLIPLLFLCCYSGNIFYNEGPRQSIYVSTAYAAFLSPIFSLFMSGIMIGLIFKFEGFYRGILEWRGWTTLSRLSYSAYLLHAAFVRNYIAAQTQTMQAGTINIVAVCLTILIITFVAAFFFYLLVEKPLNNIVKMCLSKRPELKDMDVKSTANQDQPKSKEEI